MARQQVPIQLSLGSVTTTPKQLNVTTIYVTSFIVQAPAANTDYIKLGSLSGQLYQVAPGGDLAIKGDALDNGTQGYLDLSQWYVVAVSATQAGSVTYLDRY